MKCMYALGLVSFMLGTGHLSYDQLEPKEERGKCGDMTGCDSGPAVANIVK